MLLFARCFLAAIFPPRRTNVTDWFCLLFRHSFEKKRVLRERWRFFLWCVYYVIIPVIPNSRLCHSKAMPKMITIMPFKNMLIIVGAWKLEHSGERATLSFHATPGNHANTPLSTTYIPLLACMMHTPARTYLQLECRVLRPRRAVP